MPCTVKRKSLFSKNDNEFFKRLSWLFSFKRFSLGRRPRSQMMNRKKDKWKNILRKYSSLRSFVVGFLFSFRIKNFSHDLSKPRFRMKDEKKTRTSVRCHKFFSFICRSNNAMRRKAKLSKRYKRKAVALKDLFSIFVCL